MVEKYTKEELENFVYAIKDASLAIAKINPVHYIISLNGGLPLFDVLTILDRTVDSGKALYFAGSSKIKDSAEVLTRSFENFLKERMDQTSSISPLTSLDEVVSGGSVERLFNAYNAASRRIARGHLGNSQKQRKYVEEEAEHIRKQFPLSVFGIKEERDEKVVQQKPEYKRRVKTGEVLEFPTKKIITMDDVDYQTIRFARPDSSGFRGQGYFPKVEEIVFTREYMDLLHDIARLIGLDPANLNPSRARVASDCDKYSKKPVYS